MALAGQSLAHNPQPIHAEKSNIGSPLYLSGNTGFSSGYLLVAGLVKVDSTALLNI
jgi:hypothetical protein